MASTCPTSFTQVLADDSNQDKLRSIIVVFKPLREYLGQVVPSLVWGLCFVVLVLNVCPSESLETNSGL